MLSYTRSSFSGKASIIIIVIFVLFSVGCSTTYLNLKEHSTAQIEEKLIDYQQDEDVGAEVILSLKNSKEINGELLSIRDNAVTICTEYSATELELANLTFPITTIRNDEIKELTIEGSNYVWVGLGIGIAVGAGVGALVGSTERSDRWRSLATVVLMVLGSAVGALIGPIVGYLLSTDDIILQEIPPDYDLSVLKPLARYPDEEPEYLKAIK